MSKLYAHNKSGITGVNWDARRGKWRAGIHRDGKQVNLGFFATREAAIAVRQQAEVEYHARKGGATRVRLNAPEPASQAAQSVVQAVPPKPVTKARDLRWSHIHAVIRALEQGASTDQARRQAGIGSKLWQEIRAKRLSLNLKALLTKTDPDGEPAYLSLLDELIDGRRGRPRRREDDRPAPSAWVSPAEDLFL